MPHWLEGLSGSVQVAVETVLAASALVVGVLMPAAVVSRRSWPASPALPETNDLDELAFTAGPAGLEGTLVDLEKELWSLLRELESFARQRMIKLEFAAERGVEARIDRRALEASLRTLVCHAVCQSENRVLVTAGRHGGRVQISVTDDGKGASRSLQESQLRSAERLIALQGGTFEVRTRTGAGTTLLMRLLEPGPVPAGPPEAAEHASVLPAPAAPARARAQVERKVTNPAS